MIKFDESVRTRDSMYRNARFSSYFKSTVLTQLEGIAHCGNSVASANEESNRLTKSQAVPKV